MSHNANTCKAIEDRVQVWFKRNDIGSLYVIMNQMDCKREMYHYKIKQNEKELEMLNNEIIKWGLTYTKVKQIVSNQNDVNLTINIKISVS